MMPELKRVERQVVAGKLRKAANKIEQGKIERGADLMRQAYSLLFFPQSAMFSPTKGRSCGKKS